MPHPRTRNLLTPVNIGLVATLLQAFRGLPTTMATVKCGPLVGTTLVKLVMTEASWLLSFVILVALAPVVTWHFPMPIIPSHFLVMDLTVPPIRLVIDLLTMCAEEFLRGALIALLVRAIDPTSDRRPCMFPPLTAVMMPASRSVPMEHFRLNRTAPSACLLYDLGALSRLCDLFGTDTLSDRLTLNPARHLHCRPPAHRDEVTIMFMPEEPPTTLVRA